MPLAAVLVEDSPEIREQVGGWLFAAPGRFTPAGVFGDAARAIAWARGGGSAQVALVDLRLPDRSGVEVIAELRERIPDIACVAFTAFDDEESIVAAARAGADGYLLKDTPPERLRAALEGAAAGEMPLSGRAARALLRALRRPPPVEATATSLTERERDVLVLLAKGLTYEDIGSVLGVRLGTVQCHVKRIYGKLEVNNKAEAALVAARLGLV